MQNTENIKDIKNVMFHTNVLIKSMIGYCRHDIEKTEEISNILDGLIELEKQQQKLYKIIQTRILSLK